MSFSGTFFLSFLALFSLGCSAEYELDTGGLFCINKSQLVDYKKSQNSGNKYREIIVEIEDMPIETTLTHSSRNNSKSLLVSLIGDASYLENLNKALEAAMVSKPVLTYEKELGLFKLSDMETNKGSALNTYRYFKNDPRENNALQPETDLYNKYLGLCVEGIRGRADHCTVNHTVDGILVEFSLVHSALSEWESILAKVDGDLKSLRCAPRLAQ